MRRAALILLCAAPLAMAAPAFASGDFGLFGFSGFDFESPNPGAAYLDGGEGYELVGLVTDVGPLLSPYIDSSAYEYTLHLRNLTVIARSFTFPFLIVRFANDGRGSYYADNFPVDGGTSATYGVDPPIATAPSTFIDGTLDPMTGERVTFDVDDFVLAYNVETNLGGLGGTITIDAGPDLIYLPPSQRTGWSLSLSIRTDPVIPAGYDHHADGTFLPPDTPVTHRTWGALKALYR